MNVRIAYIEEPPYYWTAEDGSVVGADIELADAVLRAIGITSIRTFRCRSKSSCPVCRKAVGT